MRITPSFKRTLVGGRASERSREVRRVRLSHFTTLSRLSDGREIVGKEESPCSGSGMATTMNGANWAGEKTARIGVRIAKKHGKKVQGGLKLIVEDYSTTSLKAQPVLASYLGCETFPRMMCFVYLLSSTTNCFCHAQFNSQRLPPPPERYPNVV